MENSIQVYKTSYSYKLPKMVSMTYDASLLINTLLDKEAEQFKSATEYKLDIPEDYAIDVNTIHECRIIMVYEVLNGDRYFIPIEEFLKYGNCGK